MLLNVSQLYSGYRRVPVIKDVSFSMQPGEIIGLVGLNGAGKSTLLKTILGLLIPQRGEVLLGGVTIAQDHQAYAQQLAYVPESPILYQELTLKDHLEMTALGYDLPVDQVLDRAQPLLRLFRLEDKLDWFPVHFSKGMQQKVMIISALVTDARLLIIDEPFLGLDPLAIRDFGQLLRDRANQGTGVLLTTHMLHITEQLCHGYLFLKEGQLVGQGDLPALRQQFSLEDASLEDLYVHITEGVERP